MCRLCFVHWIAFFWTICVSGSHRLSYMSLTFSVSVCLSLSLSTINNIWTEHLIIAGWLCVLGKPKHKLTAKCRQCPYSTFFCLWHGWSQPITIDDRLYSTIKLSHVIVEMPFIHIDTYQSVAISRNFRWLGWAAMVIMLPYNNSNQHSQRLSKFSWSALEAICIIIIFSIYVYVYVHFFLSRWCHKEVTA